MLQVTCEKTGLQFEAATKRTKNHPKIMNIINEANKDGWYREALAALQDGRDAGLDTFEDFLELLQQTKTSALNQQMEDYRALLARKRAEREQRILVFVNRQDYVPVDHEVDSGIEYAELMHRPQPSTTDMTEE